MQNCTPDETIQPGTSHMAAISRYDPAGIADVCKGISKKGSIVGIASRNSKNQTVISGNNAAVIEVVKVLENRGVITNYLPVGGPFHSSIMAKAREGMPNALEGIVINTPKFPIALNVSGKICYYDTSEIREDLIWQPEKVVEWDESLRAVIKAKYPNFIACGVGDVQEIFLRKMKKEFPQINILKLEDSL
jgi:[acyl-carrier-protein] S-malonyltransferase